MITSYRKKPVVIQAVKCDGNKFEEVQSFCGDSCSMEYYDAAYESGVCAPCYIPTINTLEGDMVARVGDYIIKGVNGEFYPCKPDIFEKTYEKEKEQAK